MPTAREALLDAAYTSLATRPWTAVRMVDVAASAGVSRQTLYNEFGSKDGLARALVRREADGFLAGVDRVLAEKTGSDADRLVGVAEWIVRAARANVLVRALVTGCWSDRLPSGRAARGVPAGAAGVAQRRADGGAPGAGELLGVVRERAEAAGVGGAVSCEAVVRVAVSWVVAPGSGGVGEVVRGVLRG
ncbi:TetR/AcrR family transcriptional regulator [Streptomyces sp. NBC_00237]|uniref:TetR/AcrR family transcriptional regulator n=1 Tax=Streptomyces sp. NBC_00237 TaxID=2975687 RepID=UPI0022521E6A|nr:TetR/AcrR family transcriptional regulator [Streptomyces sp. NBC_00237]MCX5204338.1 TetR/AcrR family transcriptional regulator [Streptomyces sp. NBC_00237]